MTAVLPQITVLGVLNAAATAIRTDSATTSFLNTNYGAPFNLFIGLDRVNPPGESQTPFLVVTPGSTPYDMGQAPAGDERSVNFEIYFGIKDASKTNFNQTTLTTTQAGLTNIDALGNLILAALYTAFPDNLFKANYLLYGEEPPLFEGAMACQIGQWIGLDFDPALNA